MRSELQSVLDSLPQIPRERLPELCAELELLRATAWQQLSLPVITPNGHDELLNVRAACERLGCSRNYLYRHAGRYPFTRRMGRTLRFSSNGIDEYIRQRR
jgi:excisionase family DNA binding protein